jgi:hypothetical protein
MIELGRAEAEVYRQRLSSRDPMARAPRDATEGKAALLAIVAAAVDRLEAQRAGHANVTAAGAADSTEGLSFDVSDTGEWLRRHQATCARTLSRTFDTLRKIRKEFGADPRAESESEDQSCPTVDENGPHSRDPEPEPAPASGPCDLGASGSASTREQTREGEAPSEPASPEAPACSQTAEVSREGEAPSEPASPEAPVSPLTVDVPCRSASPRLIVEDTSEIPTNEPTSPTGSGAQCSELATGAGNSTNEANSPKDATGRPLPTAQALAVLLLAMSCCAGLVAAVSAGMVRRTDAAPQTHRDTQRGGDTTRRSR